MNSENIFVKIINEICSEEGIAIISLSHEWVHKLTLRDRTEFIIGHNFNLNPAASKAICDDKVAASMVMEASGIPCVEHQLFMAPSVSGYTTDQGNWPRLVKLLHQYGNNMVCKDNHGQAGKRVILVHSQLELERATTEIFSATEQMAVCQFEKIYDEHRIIMLDDKPLLVFKKDRASDEWRHNLSLGAHGVVETDTKKLTTLLSLARTTMACLGMRFASVDIITTKTDQKSWKSTVA